MMKLIIILFIVIFLVAAALSYYFLFSQKPDDISKNQEIENNNSVKLADFYKINQNFLFSATILNEFEAEYIPGLKAVNIYNPVLKGDNNIEKSQLYISFFKASKFLTLSTVDITRQDEITTQGREAILYEITKKESASNFSGQPNWRNFKHKALDIRLSQDSPTYFYSFAYNPNLEEKVFNDIIDSLIFYPPVK